MKKFSLRPLFTGLLPLFILAHFGHHLLTALPIPLLPMIRADFGLDYTQSGLVISAFTLAYGISQLPAGWLADRIGSRTTVTIGICGVALAGILVGLSPTYMILVTFMALMGAMGGGYHPAAPPIILASVEPKKRGRALGLHMIGGSASYFLSPLIAAAIATVWGWRGSFIGLAALAFLFGTMFYVLLGRRLPAKKTATAITTATPQQISPVPGLWRRLTFFILMSTSAQAIMISTISFIPLYLVDNIGMGKERAAAFIAAYYAAGLWAGPLGGYLSDRLGRVSVVMAVCFITGPAIYLLNLTSDEWAIGALLIVLGAIPFIRMPVSEAYILGQTPERNRSTILGIYYFGNMEGGGILTPVMGYLIDHFGFYPSFSIAAATVFATTLFCSIWLWGSHD